MSQTKRPAIPAALDQFGSAIKENLETLTGIRGNPLDRAVTLRDMMQAGWTQNQGGSVSVTSAATVIGNAAPAPTPVQDFTVPPVPTHLVTAGALASIMLTWDVPAFFNYAYTEIWRAGSNDLTQATRIGTSVAGLYADYVGAAVTAWYWVRFISSSTPSMVGPYNNTEGTQGQTSQDPAYMLSVLSGQITASQLAQALASRIDLIDGPATLPNSVAAQVNSEMQARVSADALLGERVDTVSALAGGKNTVYLQGTQPSTPLPGDVWINTTTNNSLSTWDGANWVAATDGVTAAALSTETNARVAADQALSTRMDNLAAASGGASAQVDQEAQARIAGDNANTTLINNLQASLSANGTQTVTADAFSTLQNTVVNQGNTLSSTGTSLTNLQNSLSVNGTQTVTATALSTLQNTVTSQGSTQTSQGTSLTNLQNSLSVNGTQTVTAAALSSLQNTVTSQGNTLTSQGTSLTGLENSLSVNGTQTVTAAALSSLQTTVTNQGGSITANAQNISTLQTTVGGQTTSIQTLQNVTTGSGGLTAQYSVKLDANGYVSGFGLYNQGAASSFIVRTDTFAIVPPSTPKGTAGTAPFVVNNGTVYLASAMIQNASITNAMIGSLAVDDGKISSLSAAKLTAGTIGAQKIYLGGASFLLDGSAQQLAVIDSSGYQRVQLGNLGGGSFGLVLRDANNQIFLNSGGIQNVPATAIAGNIPNSQVAGLGSLATQSTVPTSQVTGLGSLATQSSADWSSQVTGTGKPANNATKNTVTYATAAPASPTNGDLWINTGVTPNTLQMYVNGAWQTGANLTTNTNQLTDGAGLGATATWGNVTGTGKPADNATVNRVTYSASAPAGPVNGDIWINTGVTPNTVQLYVSGAWQAGANLTTNTNQLTDGAGLGTTATWGSVTGTGKPADNADVTANNTAKNIANQGAFATLNQINNSNISTYIAGAAIGTAQIGTAQIDTLRVANNAISTLLSVNFPTINQSLPGNSGCDIWYSGPLTPSPGLAIPSGQAVPLIWSFEWSSTVGVNGMYIEIYRSLDANFSLSSGDVRVYNSYTYAGVADPFTLNTRDTAPSGGPFFYKMHIHANNPSGTAGTLTIQTPMLNLFWLLR